MLNGFSPAVRLDYSAGKYLSIPVTALDLSFVRQEYSHLLA